MNDVSKQQVFDWLREIPDPEIPVLSITDLGIVRDIIVNDHVTVKLTPTYSGCPATEVIEQSVANTLSDHGLVNASVERTLAPPWTTDWISDEGREKLLEYGIAPPEKAAGKRALLDSRRSIICPRCASDDTTLISEFGSTACKACYRCQNCFEPFEYFKCI